jgi:spore coat protein U-like protein
MKRRGLAVIVMASAVMAQPAGAGTATSNLNVSATVASTCSITAGSLAFGTYDTITGAQVDGTATVTVACTKGAVTTITLGQGQNAGGGSTDTAPVRRMVSGLSFLSYALFSDTTRLVTWGNTALTGHTYTALSSASQALTVYGRIAASQDVPAGSFSDVVVATITF